MKESQKNILEPKIQIFRATISIHMFYDFLKNTRYMTLQKNTFHVHRRNIKKNKLKIQIFTITISIHMCYDPYKNILYEFKAYQKKKSILKSKTQILTTTISIHMLSDPRKETVSVHQKQNFQHTKLMSPQGEKFQQE